MILMIKCVRSYSLLNNIIHLCMIRIKVLFYWKVSQTSENIKSTYVSSEEKPISLRNHFSKISYKANLYAILNATSNFA